MSQDSAATHDFFPKMSDLNWRRVAERELLCCTRLRLLTCRIGTNITYR
jgi:hypothetical protein